MVSVNTVSAEELAHNLAAAEQFFVQKARQEQAGGNAFLAQELRAAAEYTGECIKIFGQTAASQSSKDTIELFMHSPIAEMLQIGRQLPAVATREAEQKHTDMGQELCVKAGCKTGSLLSNIYIAAITHGISKTVQSLPPINPTPQAVAVAADGTAIVTAVSAVADTTLVVQAGKITGGIALMSGQSGPDGTGSHEQAPQQPMSTDEKTEATVYKVDNTAKYNPPVRSSELGMSKTVEQHKLDLIIKGPRKGELARPYMTKGINLIVDEIMSAAIPVKDKFVPNGLKWEVAGSFNGTEGMWELVVDIDKKEIIHFLFNSITK